MYRNLHRLTLPDDILQWWDSYFLATEFEEFSLESFYTPLKILYTPARTGARDFHGGDECPFENIDVNSLYLQLQHLHHSFHLIPNKFPIMRHHFLFVHKEHIPMNAGGIQNDLEIMLNIAHSTGLTVYKNSPNAGASVPHHDHFQAIAQLPPAFCSAHTYVNSTSGYLLYHYGANVFFEGNSAIEQASGLVERFPEEFKSFNTVISQKKIYLFPRVRSFSEILQRPMGAANLMGYFPVRSKDKAQEMLTKAEIIRAGIAEVMYPKELIEKLL